MYARKTATTIERPKTDTRYSVWNRDICKTTAIVKRLLTDDCTACNQNGFQSSRNTSAIVRIRRCTKYVSKICVGGAVFGFSYKRNRDALKTTAIIERTIANACNAIGYCDACETTATIKCSLTNACNAIWNRNALKTAAIIKCMGVNDCTTCNHNGFQRGGNIITLGRIRRCTKDVSKIWVGGAVFGFSYKRNRNARQTTAITERTNADTCYAIGDRDARQAAAIGEGRMADACNAVGNRDAFKTTAVVERINADTCYAIGDRDTRKSSATIERPHADACYAAGDYYAFQRGATIECIITYTRNAIWNNQLRDQFAIKIQITGIG